MAIVSMNKLSLIGLETEKERILENLMKLGVVEINSSTEKMSSDLWKDLVSIDGDNDKIASLDSSLDRISSVINYLETFDNKKKGLFQGKRTISMSDYRLTVQNKDKLWSVVDKILKYDEELSNLKSERNKNSNLILSLNPWQKLTVPLDLTSTKTTSVTIGVVPEIANTDDLKNELKDNVPQSYINVVNSDKDQSYLFLIYLSNLEEDVMRILKQYGFSKVSFKDVEGTANNNINNCNKNILAIDKTIKDIEGKISSFVNYREDLEVLHDYILIERDQEKTRQSLVKTNKVFMLDGWVPQNMADGIREVMEKSTDCYVDIVEPDEGEEVPVLLANNGFSTSVESITKMYSLPNYRELDPNAIMAPFFILFFGLMLSDGGYGIIMSLVSGFILYKYPLEEGMKKFMKLMFFCGLSTILWGALFGGWFGIKGIPYLWFNPVDKPQKMLSYSLLFGVIHIYVGIGVRGINLIRKRKYMDVVYDVVFWYIFFTGFVFFTLPYVPEINPQQVASLVEVGKYLLIGGGVLLILSQGREQKNILMKLLNGVTSLYDLIGFMSDVLSYSRLLALGLATSVIASIVNDMGAMSGLDNILKILMFIAVLAVGHTFNFAINALGAYVHSSRLQYIEFFGKFYKGGGTAFEPFKVNTKYINLKY